METYDKTSAETGENSYRAQHQVEADHGQLTVKASPRPILELKRLRRSSDHCALAHLVGQTTPGWLSLTMAVDPAWPHSPERHWPITIDPTVTLTGPAVNADCHLAAAASPARASAQSQNSWAAGENVAERAGAAAEGGGELPRIALTVEKDHHPGLRPQPGANWQPWR